jgi:hypothetical protein
LDENKILSLCKEEVKNCINCMKFNLGKKGFNIIKPVIAEQPLMEVSLDIKSIHETSNRGHIALMILVDNMNIRFVWIQIFIN